MRDKEVKRKQGTEAESCSQIEAREEKLQTSSARLLMVFESPFLNALSGKMKEKVEVCRG